MSAWLFVAVLVAAIVLVGATPAPPTAGGTATLDYIAAHRTLYIVHQQLWLVPGLFGMVIYLALYPALKNLHRSLAALGTMLGGSVWALTLTYLSDQFVASTDPARRAALAAAASPGSPGSRRGTFVSLLTTQPPDRVEMPYLTPSAFTRHVINPLVSKLHTGGVVTLTVAGRGSGHPRRVPVIPVTIGDQRYLVSPYGETDWVRNLRAAGQGHLRGRGTAEAVHASEVPVPERAAVIAAYRKIAGRTVAPCFAALPDPADHPVFRIE